MDVVTIGLALIDVSSVGKDFGGEGEVVLAGRDVGACFSSPKETLRCPDFGVMGR